MPLVAGIDSSTQSCTVLLRDADDGRIVAVSSAPHPTTTPPISEQDPRDWWTALAAAVSKLPMSRVAAVSVDGQGHGLVALDAAGEVVRPAKLWNDTTSAPEATELVLRLGAGTWARRTGSVPTAAFTITKLLWLARHEPKSFALTHNVLLPGDWVTYQLTGALTTDRSAASGTGYFSPVESAWQLDLLELAGGAGWAPELPRVLGVDEQAGVVTSYASRVLGLGPATVVGPGSNDQAACALGLGIREGDVLISFGTSGVVCTCHRTPTADDSGAVTGVADARGGFLPLVCTLNAARVTDAFARLLGVDLDALAGLALAAPARPDRPILVPYLDGERTPNRPDATGLIGGFRSDVTRQQLARAAFEGVILGILDGLQALNDAGVRTDGRVVLTGGGSRSPAYRQLLADLSGREVRVADIGEASAAGAAIQAAAALRGRRVAEIAEAWAPDLRPAAEPRANQAAAEVQERFRKVASSRDFDV